MLKGSITTKILIAFFSIFFIAIPTSAQNLPVRPSFPVCSTPQGLIKADYDSGIHGVPGDSTTYNGSDTVYHLSESTLTQCLCTTNGKGIQTNWWRISSLSFDEIETLEKLGWVYVPNGSEWGLDEVAYLANSSDYDCGIDEDDEDNDDDDDDDDKNSNGSSNKRRIGGAGQVLAATSYLGDVLGLASTGNSMELISYVFLAATSIALLAYYVAKQDKK